MQRIIALLLVSILYFLNIPFSYSQIGHGGAPLSSKFGLSNNINFIKLSPVDNEQEREENMPNDDLKLYPFAKMIDVSIDVFENATLDSLSDGTLWRMGIISQNALSIYTVFSKFSLPDDAYLFVYSANKKQILGKFTSDNNKANGKLTIMPVAGDTVIYEYFQANSVKSKAELIISLIGHDYRGIIPLLDNSKDGSFGSSGDCNVDINCFEGTEWQKEKHAVCRIIANGSLCTGTLVNNTNFDARPLFLTAHHCISEQATADNMLCVFNYESAICNGEDGSVEQSISGGLVRATTDNLDFCLIELSESPLPSFQPYFAAWNRVDTPAVNTTCIHHPHGDVKKISKDDDASVTGDYGYGFDNNSHWLISDWELGTTEGGSSGSPLFNQNHQVIGDLTGGEASCANSVNDYFSKFAIAWDSYSDHNKQLKYWLDPAGTEAEQIAGYDPYYGQNAPVANFSSSQTQILAGSLTGFTDLSEGNVNSWYWTFDGATPNHSTEQFPRDIKFTYAGTFNVSLVVTNSYGSDTEIKQSFITVSDGCIRSSNIAEDETLYLYTFSGNEWGYWTGHNEHGFSEFAERYTNQSGNFVHGVYILPARADYSNASDFVTIKVRDGGGKPGSVLYSVDKSIASFSPGVWKFISFQPAVETDGSFYVGYEIYYNQQDTFAVPHAEPRGAGGLNTTFVKDGNIWKSINTFSPDMSISLCVEPYICGTLSSIDEDILSDDVIVFPNPANDELFIDISALSDKLFKIEILTITGQILISDSKIAESNLISLDISNLSSGIYFISLSSKNNRIVKTLEVFRH